MAKESVVITEDLVKDLEALVNYSHADEEASFQEYLEDQGVDTSDPEEVQKEALATEVKGGHIFGAIARLSKWLDEQKSQEEEAEHV